MSDDRVILRTWEMESSHNYENNQNFTKVSYENAICDLFSFLTKQVVYKSWS